MAQRELSGAAAEVSRNIEGASQNGVGAGAQEVMRADVQRQHNLADPLDVKKDRDDRRTSG